MRYRLHINRAEYVGATVAFVEGSVRLYSHHSNVYSGSVWHILSHNITPYLLLSTPLLLYLQFLSSYVELTPSSIESQALWRHRSIPYTQLERIVPLMNTDKLGSSNALEIYGAGIKKLRLSLQEPAAFLTELRQYAPQAHMEGPALA